MADAILMSGGGNGIYSSDVTASKADVLSGKRTITSDSGDVIATGTMPNRGAVNQSLGINGTYAIPAGYHNGNGKVTQKIDTLGTTTYYPTVAAQTILANRYLSGNQIIHALSHTNLASANILYGKTIKINNGNKDIWSVSGAANVLKYVSGTVTLGTTVTGVNLDDGKRLAYYYYDVAPGFTPVFAFFLSPQMYTWISGNVGHIIQEGAGDTNYQGQFSNASSVVPFTASTVRVMGYPTVGSPAPRACHYWIFGY